MFFDTDDWVFDFDVPKYVPAFYDLSDDMQRLYIQGLRRYQRTMAACDGVIVTTESLRQLALRHNDNVVVVPNVVSKVMLQHADSALQFSLSRKRTAPRDTVTIGYFSGTATHNRDFLQAADAVLWALDRYPEVLFKVVGQLKLDERFERFGPRVLQFGIQNWEDLPRLYTTVDISIAPLEPDNPYTDAKSCIKYLEAAICEVPTVASPRTDFRRVIVHGENALLADSPDDWKDAFARLIESSDFRRDIGHRASECVRTHETTLSRSDSLLGTIQSLAADRIANSDKRPLTINWVLRAPIGERGGGYRTIFRLANYLGRRGHSVRVYVQPTDHLSTMTVEQIHSYVEKYFGPLNVELIVGHEHIQPADASIATFWTTANVVEKNAGSLHKFYFIQDFEPEFYDPADQKYLDAELTYNLPLQHVCIGRHLGQRIEHFAGRPPEIIDFAIDHDIFQLTCSPEERKGPLKVLFFSRPGLKRRGFELGIEALRRVKEQYPDVDILLFGSTDRELGMLPFSATNLGILNQRELADTLNRVHILLCFSLSNISWVPFEGMASGAAVVEADVPSVRAMVPSNEACVLARPHADSVAEAVGRLVADDALRCRIANAGVQFMADRTWERTQAEFEEMLLRHCWLRDHAAQVPGVKNTRGRGVMR